MSIPENTKTPLSVDLTSVPGGVLIRMKAEVRLKGEYVRCLNLVSVHHEADTSDICFGTAPSPGEEDLEADDFLFISAHGITGLKSLLHGAIVALIDERPLCSEDCQGLCDVCSERRADLPADHSRRSIDPRLATFTPLLESDQKGAD